MTDKRHITAPILLIAVMLLSAVLNVIDVKVLGEGETAFLSVALMQLAVLFIPALLYSRLLSMPRSAMRLRPLPAANVRFVVYSAFTLIFGSMLISFAMYALGIPVSVSSSYSDLIPEGFASRAILIALAFAVVPAVAEEFLCRCVIMSEYENVGMLSAVFVSSLSFAMLHFSLGSFPVYFFSGLIFGFSVFVTRSALASVILHLFYNLYILFFQDYTEKLINTPRDTAFVVVVAAALFMLFLFLMLSEAEKILRRNGLENLDPDAAFQPQNRRITLSAVLLSPTFLAAVAVYLILAIMIA